MGDLTSRSALIENFKKSGIVDSEDDAWVYSFAIAMIESTPIVDAVPVVHGEWIKKVRNNGGYIASITCSACGYSHSRVTYNFCPECGADMRKDGANDV